MIYGANWPRGTATSQTAPRTVGEAPTRPVMYGVSRSALVICECDGDDRATPRASERTTEWVTVVDTFCEPSLDDLMRRVVGRLLSTGTEVSPTRGEALELTGASLELTNPLARLSRSETRGRLFSAIGELFWYLSGTNSSEQITYYIPQYEHEIENGGIYGGYGPRLLNWDGINQLRNVVDLLRVRPESRRAAMQIFDRRDINEDHLEIPCTCTMQFLVREGHLQMMVYMRSNDAYLGLPHDIFAFTMLQEIVAGCLNVPPGKYCHFVGSLHLYSRNKADAEAFLAEGWQSNLVMPPMPNGDQWEEIRQVMDIERHLRQGQSPTEVALPPEPYWADIGRLLCAYAASRQRNRDALQEIRGSMASRVYDLYLETRLDML